MDPIPHPGPIPFRFMAGGCALAALACLFPGKTTPGVIGLTLLWVGCALVLFHVLTMEFNTLLREGTEPRLRLFSVCLAGILAGSFGLLLYIVAYLAMATLWTDGVEWSALLSREAVMGMLGLIAVPSLALTGLAWVLPWLGAGLVRLGDDGPARMRRILRLWPSCALACAVGAPFFIWALARFLRSNPSPYPGILLIALAGPPVFFALGLFGSARIRALAREGRLR